jgi:hypothetical protein
MNRFTRKKQGVLALGLLLSSLLVSGCGGGSSDNPSDSAKSYRVVFKNMTANQPMSPATIVIHRPGYHMWQAGQAASIALENLAEGGSNQQVLDAAKNHPDYIVSKAGSGVIPPGGSETLELEVGDASGFRVTVATMLVNTNDAFAGVVSDKIAGLAKGERFSMNVPVWDAGTEANSEAAGTLPGPADGGEGFNASRAGDSGFVAIHQGVVTHADGLATSVLDESHRFDNPVGLISVERIN